MGKVVGFPVKSKYEIDYIFEDEKVVAISHPKWPFRIQRKESRIALVSDDDDQPFGEIDADVFNTILMCWLLIDAPHLMDGSCDE